MQVYRFHYVTSVRFYVVLFKIKINGKNKKIVVSEWKLVVPYSKLRCIYFWVKHKDSDCLSQ